MHPREKPAARPFKIHPTVFVAETATVVGDVTIARDSSVWFGAVLRGDDAPVTVGEGTNVQDNAVLHEDLDLPCTIGNRVTIGHGAIIHGATVEDDVLIGMGAIILNGARIGSWSIVGAGAVVPEGMQVPSRSLVLGVPARVTRPVRDEEIERIKHGSTVYIERARNYWKGIHK